MGNRSEGASSDSPIRQSLHNRPRLRTDRDHLPDNFDNILSESGLSGLADFRDNQLWLNGSEGASSDSPIRQSLHNRPRLQTDRDDLSDNFDNILWILLTVRVVEDAATLVRLDAILVDYPFQRCPIPSR